MGRRDVGYAKGVPQHNVGVVDGLAAVADPLREASRRLARCVRYISSCRSEMVVAV